MAGNLPSGRSATGAGVEAVPVVILGADGNPIYTFGGGTGGDASAANQTAGNTSLNSIDTKTPPKGSAVSAQSSPVVIASDQAMVPVNPLGQPGVARQIVCAANAANANVALTAAIRRVSLCARGSSLRYIIGTTATTSSHYIGLNERLDINVPAGSTLAALSDTGTAGTLEITELT